MAVLQSTLKLTLLDQVSSRARAISGVLNGLQNQQRRMMAPLTGGLAQFMALAGAYVGVTQGIQTTIGAAISFEAAVVGAFGEQVRHLPQKSGTADPGRPVQVIKGVLHTPTPAGTISLGSGIITTLSASEGALVVERAAYPDVIFKALDKLVGIELTGSPQWEIKTVNDRFSSIIVLVLNQK